MIPQATEEPPDPRTARLYLLDHFTKRSVGQPYDPAIRTAGNVVIADLRNKLRDPTSNSNYAHGAYQLANSCYRGASGKKQLDDIVTFLAIDIEDPDLPPARAAKLKEGLQELHNLIEKSSYR